MPFQEDQPVTGPLALPRDFDLNPDIEQTDGNVMGAAMRQENIFGSLATSFRYDRSAQFDPDFRPYDDIQGTEFEPYWERFTEARNADEAAKMKAQITREIEDQKTLAAAGGWGMLATMSAGLLSPTSLLPGGAVIKGASGGVKIGRTAMSVAGWNAVAVAMDEVALQSSQETRTGADTAMGIGGGIILGGLLGGGVGAMTRKAQLRTSATIEALPEGVHEFDEALRSLSAASADNVDMTLRGGAIEALNKIPVLRGLVRSDPLLRAQLSTNNEVRRTVVGLVETALQYKANEGGEVVSRYGQSAETAIKARRNTELAQSYSYLGRAYAEYVSDGPVGMIGRATAPVTGRFASIMDKGQKFTRGEFLQEVGKAAMEGDTHPIPQVAKAAQEIRKNIFEKAKADAIEVGLFDEDLQLKFGDSFFSRVYVTEKIKRHMGDGTQDDISVMLREEFTSKRDAAQLRLENDDTVQRMEDEKFQTKERMRGAQSALKKAQRKAQGKRDTAKAAVKRESAVGRVSGALRKAFQDRAKGLSKGVLDGKELDDFKDMLRDARGLKRLEPEDINTALRRMGGLRDDGSGELQAVMGDATLSIKRTDGLTPDYAREALEDLGFLPQGSTVNDMYEAMGNSARGDKVYSIIQDAEDIARFEAAREFSEAMTEMGIDVSKPVDEIIKDLPGKARNQSKQKGKASEAARSGKRAGKAEGAASSRLMKAMDRLEEANARIKELDDEIAPKVREEIKAAQDDLKKLLPEIKKAKDARSADEFYASKDDLEIQSDVESTVNSILGMKPGEHSFSTSLSDPTKARVLDVHDSRLRPWLETDMGVVMAQYFNGIIPDIEIVRRFGNIEMTEAVGKIVDEKDRLVRNAKTEKEKVHHQEEAENRIRELYAMRDRIRGTYGVPDNPRDIITRAGRGMRTLSYTGYLGGMTLSAIPDVANVIGRGGIEAAFGSTTALTDPGRFKLAVKDSMDLGAAAEWYLNSRAMSIADVADEYGANTGFERAIGAGGRMMGVATGMLPWNVGWKAVGGAMISSKLSKAAFAVHAGKATKADLISLSDNMIDLSTAQKIGAQIEQFGDMDGHMWLPKAGDWVDQQAFEAFRNAFNREIDIMIVTPGQDKPLMFSTEVGKFFSQFKSFAVSAHHRILLSGLQRKDAAVLAQFTTAVLLGGLVSNIKADQSGFERKTGAAFWEDAFDRSGWSGWLMEAHGLANGFAGGQLSLSGEQVSRYGSRSTFNGLLGPSVDMAAGVYEGVAAMSRGQVSSRDTRKILRPMPGNNLPYIIGLTKKVAEAMADISG